MQIFSHFGTRGFEGGKQVGQEEYAEEFFGLTLTTFFQRLLPTL